MSSFYSGLTRYRPLDGQRPAGPDSNETPRRDRANSFLGRLFPSQRPSSFPGRAPPKPPDEHGTDSPPPPSGVELQEVLIHSDHDESRAESRGESQGDSTTSPPSPNARDGRAPSSSPPKPTQLLQHASDEGEDSEDSQRSCDEETPLNQLPNTVHLHISGRPATKPTPVDLRWSIGEAKKHLFPNEHATKRIRMISRGKLLDDENAILKDFVEDAGHIHVSITDRRRPGEAEEAGVVEPAENDENQLLEDLRLARVLQFGTEDWEGDDPTQPREGSNAEFILFFVAGLLLGFIMLIFLFQARLTRKKKLGILTGIAVHVLYHVSGSEISKGFGGF